MPIAQCFDTTIVTVPGDTTIVQTGNGGKRLMAQIDFSLAGNSSINLSADGNYTFACTPGGALSTITGRLKNIGNNAGGSWAVSSGKLVSNTPTTVTSPWGKMYWSSVHAPFLAFDARQFGEIASDVGGDKWKVVCEVEYDPMFTQSGTTWTSTCGTYQWLIAGVCSGMDTYWAGSATEPTRWAGSLHRSESLTASTASAWPYGMSYKIGWTPSSNHLAGQLSAYSANTSPYNTLSTVALTKMGTSWGNRHFENYFTNGTALIKYFNGANDPISGNSLALTWDPTMNTGTGGWPTAFTNDLWAYVMISRSTGSGATSVKINKINIYIVENI